METNAATTPEANPHRESVIDPSRYVHIAEFYDGASEEMMDAFADEHRHLAELLGDEWFDALNFHDNGGCAHCGAQFSYGAVFRTRLGREWAYIAIGHICSANRFIFNDNISMRADLAKRRGASNRANNLKRAKNIAEWEAQLADTDGLAEAMETDHYITRDMLAKRREQGALSWRQVDLAFKLQADVAAEAAEKAAEVEAEPEAPQVCLDAEVGDRVVVTATVLMVRYLDSQFGIKTLVKARTENDEVVVWWASKELGVKAGEILTGKATVKAHNPGGDYGAETTVTRWKLEEAE